MIAIFESILPIFLLVAAGVVLRRLPVISPAAWPGMEQLAYWFLYPSLLFVTIYDADFSALRIDALLAALLLCLLLMATLTLSLWPALKRGGLVRHGEFSTVFQTSIRWNGFIALPVAQSMFAPEGAAVVALAMAVIVIPINIASVFVVTRFAHGRAGLGHVLLRMARNPLIVASGAGVLMRLMPFELYGPLNVTLRLVGEAGLGLGLMAIGASLRLGQFTGGMSALLLPTCLKLVVFPAAMAAVALSLGLSGQQLQYLILCAAVPSATNGYLLARQLGGDAELYAAIVTVQTGLSFLTLPVALALAAQFSSG